MVQVFSKMCIRDSRPAPSYEEQQSTTEILETGIKVVDLILSLIHI